MIFLVFFWGFKKNGGFRVQKTPYFRLFSFCNPSHYCKHASNLNVEWVNLNVIAKREYSIIFLHSVRNFAFMSEFGKLRWFLIVFDTFLLFAFLLFAFLLFCFFTFCFFVALSYKLCYNIFCWHGANKTQRPLSEFLFALFFYCWC